MLNPQRTGAVLATSMNTRSIRTDELVFTERVRAFCRAECPMYNKSWACPPAVGSVEACRERCLASSRNPDAPSVTGKRHCRPRSRRSPPAPHEELTREAAALVKAQGEIYVLSTEACAICERCAWPGRPAAIPTGCIPAWRPRHPRDRHRRKTRADLFQRQPRCLVS